MWDALSLAQELLTVGVLDSTEKLAITFDALEQCRQAAHEASAGAEHLVVSLTAALNLCSTVAVTMLEAYPHRWPIDTIAGEAWKATGRSWDVARQVSAGMAKAFAAAAEADVERMAILIESQVTWPSAKPPLGPLWPNGAPDDWPGLERSPAPSGPAGSAFKGSSPSFVVVWDPKMITPGEYARLVEALGDVVRAAGGTGVERVRTDTFGAPAGKGALQP
jgi:hypothetical protein